MVLTEKQTLKELMIKYGFKSTDMTVTEFVEDILPSAQQEPLKITIDDVPTADELERIKQAMRNTPIMLLPPAQPEIIRCKDCKYRYVDGDNVRFNVCELNHNKVQSDEWYCADAERRTDE